MGCIETLLSMLKDMIPIGVLRGPLSGRPLIVYATRNFLITTDPNVEDRENKIVMVFDRRKQEILYASRASHKLTGWPHEEKDICEVVQKLREEF